MPFDSTWQVGQQLKLRVVWVMQFLFYFICAYFYFPSSFCCGSFILAGVIVGTAENKNCVREEQCAVHCRRRRRYDRGVLTRDSESFAGGLYLLLGHWSV